MDVGFKNLLLRHDLDIGEYFSDAEHPHSHRNQAHPIRNSDAPQGKATETGKTLLANERDKHSHRGHQ